VAYIAGAGHAGDTRNLERIVLRILYARRHLALVLGIAAL
jgi:hypothetical protein